MPEDENKGGGSSGEGEQPSPELKTLQEQIENLNKGIAKYRDEATNATKKAEEIGTKYEELLKKLEETDDEDLEELDEKDLKKFEAFAKKHGLVTKQELEKEAQKSQEQSVKQMQDQAITEFLEANPEFDDDEEWEKVKEQFQLYRTPSSLSGFRNLLSKIKKDLKGEDTKQQGRDEARAQTRKRDRLSLGGGSQKSGDSKAIEDLQKKYPNLSRDQIEATLSEIESFYPEKKK